MNRIFLALGLVRGLTAERVRAGIAQAQADFTRLHRWLRKVGPFYFGSAFAHILIVAIILSWTFNKQTKVAALDEPQVDTEIKDDVIEFQLGTSPLLPSDLSPETIARFQQPHQTQQQFDEQPVFEDAGGGTQTLATQPLFGGLGGFEPLSIEMDGPRVFGDGGVGIGLGGSARAGNGGALDGMDGAGHGKRDDVDGPRDEDKADRAVAAALNWFYRHQHVDGHWSLSNFDHCTTDSPCHDAGQVDADAAATALALLSFLSAGQSPEQAGFYQSSVARGVDWLVKRQQSSGDLAGEDNSLMYAQALATLALCEAYGKTRDPHLGSAAQRAVRSIEAAQNPQTGGWHMEPGDPGDTACAFWHVMALHSAQRAGLEVSDACLQNARAWFRGVSQGEHGGLVASVPGALPTVASTAMGLLSRQQLGDSRKDPHMLEALSVLHAAVPDESQLADDLFRSFAMTQALHAHDPLSTTWDAWNLIVRRALLATQEKEGCAAGSWYPENSGEIWTRQGGRHLATSLATLTLAVSYRGDVPIRDVPWLLVRRPEKTQTPQRPAGGKAQPARQAPY